MFATSRSHIEVLKFLLENGAQVNAVEKHGYSALKIASEGSRNDCIDLLLLYGADLIKGVRMSKYVKQQRKERERKKLEEINKKNEKEIKATI